MFSGNSSSNPEKWQGLDAFWGVPARAAAENGRAAGAEGRAGAEGGACRAGWRAGTEDATAVEVAWVGLGMGSWWKKLG